MFCVYKNYFQLRVQSIIFTSCTLWLTKVTDTHGTTEQSEMALVIQR